VSKNKTTYEEFWNEVARRAPIPISKVDALEKHITELEQRLAAAEFRNADLSMLVARLIRKNPESELSIKAVDYLKRNNLIGSPLKAEAPGVSDD